jgi:UDP-N-acetylglucosamine 2-epimerase (non-hydrolysing)
MVVIFYGTSAELIKMLGIVKRIPRSEQLLICSAQHNAGLKKVHAQLGIKPDMYLSQGWRGNDVATMGEMAGMMLRVHGSFLRKFRTIKKRIQEHDKTNHTKSVAVVHGDTLTTVVGGYFGRMLGLPVAHVEAGLRSGSWKSPFPEEIDRRIVAKIARIHFPPNELAETNLRNENVKGEIVNTTFNTAKDAIEMADQFVSNAYKKLTLPKHYCLVLLHRTELLSNKKDLEAILKTLHYHASVDTPVVFTEHTTTKQKIGDYGLGHYLQHPYITILPKQPYFDFMAIVKKADYVVTDGGGLQEDAFFLGIPLIVHRARTERQEGIGINASLSGMDVSKVADFLEHHKDKKDFAKLANSVSPSDVVVSYLRDHHFFAD